MLEQFGLDRPLCQQYSSTSATCCSGEFGLSFLQRQPVLGISRVLPNTLLLTLTALIVAYCSATWRRLARLEARQLDRGRRHAGRARDPRRARILARHVLLAVFAFGLGWFPSGGANSAGAVYPYDWHASPRSIPAPSRVARLDPGDLPAGPAAAADALQHAGGDARGVRHHGAHEGPAEWRIVIRHAARNALLPVVTAFALGFGRSIGGNVVIETVFSWPGIGRMLVEAVPPATIRWPGRLPADRAGAGR